MAWLNPDEITDLDILSQITGFGSDMGVEITVKAPDTKKITASAQGATVKITWTETGTGAKSGQQKIAHKIPANTVINDTTGYSLGIYYPDAVFANQGEADTFMGTIVAKLYNGVLADE